MWNLFLCILFYLHVHVNDFKTILFMLDYSQFGKFLIFSNCAFFFLLTKMDINVLSIAFRFQNKKIYSRRPTSISRHSL